MENYPVSTAEAPDDDDDDDDEEVAESSSEKNDNKSDQKQSSDERTQSKKIPEKSTPETDEAAEQLDRNAPVDKLDRVENNLVAGEYIQTRMPEVSQELEATSEQTTAEAEAIANALLLEVIDQKLDQGKDATGQTFDEAVAETMQQLGIEPPEEQAETIDETGQPDIEQRNNATEPEDVGQDDEDDNTTAASSAASTAPPVPPPPPNNPPNATNTVPPNPPPNILPIAGNPGNMPPPPFNAGPGAGANAVPANPNINPNQPPIIIERRSAALPYLVIGYLLGRRRGRIKTEKKLLPVQHKLEKEVANLQKNIASREEKVRTLVREQIAARPAVAQHIVERLEKRKQAKAESITQLKSVVEDSSESGTATQMENAVYGGKRLEKLGKLVMTNEKPESRLVKPETIVISKQPERIKVPERPKSVDIMTIAELLIIANRIPIERSTVKKLFETQRLDERGLRRVIQAYLRGEHYEKTLRENQLGPERIRDDMEHDDLKPGLESRQLRRAAHDTNQPNQANPAFASAGQPVSQKTDSSAADIPKKGMPKAKNRISKTIPISIIIIIAILLVLFLLR